MPSGSSDSEGNAPPRAQHQESPQPQAGGKNRHVLRIPASARGTRIRHGLRKFVVFATHNGVVKRTNLSEFRNIRKDGINAINIEEGDYLIGCA
jgi:DNA gyrase/topoisomerase IV subunit A